MNSEQTIALINLFVFCFTEDLSKITSAVKRVLSEHHFEKLLMLETLEQILIVDQSLILPFIGKLKCKGNEPLQVKLKKLSIMKQVYLSYGSDEVLKEVLSLVRTPQLEVKKEAIRIIGDCGYALSTNSRLQASDAAAKA